MTCRCVRVVCSPLAACSQRLRMDAMIVSELIRVKPRHRLAPLVADITKVGSTARFTHAPQLVIVRDGFFTVFDDELVSPFPCVVMCGVGCVCVCVCVCSVFVPHGLSEYALLCGCTDCLAVPLC